MRSRVRTVAEQLSESLETPTEVVPDHQLKLYQVSTEHLNQEQSKNLAKLPSDYEDVFAKSDFDLGSFTAIEHTIDTGDAKPIKQRMRRTHQLALLVKKKSI
jgi:hypothetical protein